MSTTKPLPGHIFAFITCDRVKGEATIEEWAKLNNVSVEEARAEWQDDPDYNASSDTVRLEDLIQENGWIDRRWSSTVLYDSRNDVSPVVDADTDSEELADEVRDALGWLEGGFTDNGDGTFYAEESYQPFDEPWDYSYALHFVRKYLGAKGYVEVPWHPVKDGGIEL